MLEAILWLTLNVYHEARGEPELGRQAVVHVVLNRSEQRHLDIKDVILQPHQFSWTSSVLMPRDPVAFLSCLQSVHNAVSRDDPTLGATYYHEESIVPYWASEYVQTAHIGHHIFYKED